MSELKITNLIIHEIKKEENTKKEDVVSILSDTETVINDKSTSLLKSLNESFSKRSPKRGKLSSNGFKESISDFQNIKLVPESKILVNRLKDKIQEINFAKGGYLVFCQYSVIDNFLSVFLLRNTLSAIFERQNDSFDIKDTTHLNVDKFAMGVKINLTRLTDESDERYVQLSRGNTEISDYFENWIGLTDTKQESKDAAALYGLTKTIPLPQGIDNRDQLRKNIYDYANNQPHKKVNVRNLSSYLYEDEDFITQHIPPDLDIDAEFTLSGKNLNKFYKINAKADGIDLSASRDTFNNTNLIEITDDTVLIHSKDLVKEIAKQR